MARSAHVYVKPGTKKNIRKLEKTTHCKQLEPETKMFYLEQNCIRTGKKSTHRKQESNCFFIFLFIFKFLILFSFLFL